MMKWVKKGLIYKPTSNNEWMVSHAQLPTVDKIDNEVLRIYYGTRDRYNRTVTTYIEVEADNPMNVLYIHDRPVLGLGELGCFDDSGAMPSWIVTHGDVKYLFYIGWNAGRSVPYRNAIGLAISEDNGKTFTRLYRGAIVDRTKDEPHFCGSTCVIKEDGRWRMWYLSALKWIVIDNRLEPIYHIKYAESSDGTSWQRPGIVCIELKSPEEGGISRPSVIKEDGLYRMWYSYRGIRDYRKNRIHSYRIGYAVSNNGINWVRRDDSTGIDVSHDGWDSVMVAYPNVYNHNGKKYMVYNGNGFGESGFGYAILHEEQNGE